MVSRRLSSSCLGKYNSTFDKTVSLILILITAILLCNACAINPMSKLLAQAFFSGFNTSSNLLSSSTPLGYQKAFL